MVHNYANAFAWHNKLIVIYVIISIVTTASFSNLLLRGEVRFILKFRIAKQ